ncbi:hypothetical protein SprV_0401507100 [Sparganum proliferum]
MVVVVEEEEEEEEEEDKDEEDEGDEEGKEGLDLSLAFETFFEFATTTKLRDHTLELRIHQARVGLRKALSDRGGKPWGTYPQMLGCHY